MNTKLNILSASALLVLASCGSTDSQDSPALQSFTTQLFSDDTAVATTDVVIDSLLTSTTSSAHTVYEIQVTDNDAGPVDIDNLSFAVEYSRTADFNKVYRAALFDLETMQQDSNSATVTARSKPAQLPSGTYNARLVVNPNWQTYLENNVPETDLSQPLRYIAESNYTNNNSAPFAVQIESEVQCTEDTYENNNTFQNATPLSSMTTIRASLCEDNADIYTLPMEANQTSVLSFGYEGSHNGTPTQYTLISDDYYRQTTGVLEGPESQIQLTAAVSGNYYLAVFGARTNYTLNRDHRNALTADWFFSADTVAGPVSPVYGAITLTRLQFNTADLLNKTAHCTRQVIDPLAPDSYTTPPHFPGIHEFRFLDNNEYLVDGVSRYQWGVTTGDISNDDWYQNSYLGWAENLYDGKWRYWDFSGESYVQCTLK